MKKIISLLFLLLLIGIIGCNNDSGNPTGTGGLGGNGGGNNTGTVTIQVQGQDDQQGNYTFSLNPSEAISLTTVTAAVTAAQYQEDFDFSQQGQWNGSAFQPFLQYDSNVIQQGQQWQFKFVGKTVNGNKDFNVTKNYSIP